MLSEPSKTAAHSAKCFPSPRKRLRVPQNAFRTLGNSCAFRKMPSESSEMAAHSAKYFPNPRKQLRAPRNAFPSSRKSPRTPRSPSRILGNLHALREMLSKALETFARSAKCLPSPRKPLHIEKQRGTLAR